MFIFNFFLDGEPIYDIMGSYKRNTERVMNKLQQFQADTTNKIIAMLEGDLEGKWERPWVGGETAMPVSLSTGKRYQGMNVLLLWISAMDRGFTVPVWGTFNAWKSKGIFVNKGEKGTQIAMPIPFKIRDNDGNVKIDANGEEKTGIRYNPGYVFNAEQTTAGDEYRERFATEAPKLAERNAEIDLFFDNCGIEERVASHAFYKPSENWVGMPGAEMFKDTDDGTATEHYYGTRAHEFIHATGHASRCDRKLAAKFDREPYAAEELVAEMGAAILCGILGVQATVREDHAKYIKSWLTVLKNDNSAIFTAAAMANKGITWMMDQQPKDSPFRDKVTATDEE
jgi:antirestriction protein ArdC